MSKSTPQAPPTPDPSLVTQQQTGANLNTAIAQKLINDTNPIFTFRVDHLLNKPERRTSAASTCRRISQTTTFNPTVQSIINGTENVGASLMPTTAQALANEVGSGATKPLDFSGANQDYLNAGPQLPETRMRPMRSISSKRAFSIRSGSKVQKDLEDQLARQGIPPGSDAYNSAISNFQNEKTQAYQSALDSAIAQGAQNAGQLFNQAVAGPAAEISARQLAQMSPIDLLSRLYNSGVT